MSLFKAREWWHAVAGEGEQFDQGCICIGNVDNTQGGKGKEKIVVGSYHGVLRIYNPNPIKTEHGWSGFRPEELVLEQDLNAPVLQLSIGLFVSGSTKLHLAVLQPRKLAVFSVSGVAGAVQHGSQYQLTSIYEHKLQRSAFNMCHGPFGQIQGKDFVCIQSIDGSLSVFEQERFSFTRFLPGSLLPGPLHYVPQTDSFVIVSSARHVESYRYQVLAVATDAKTKEESQNIKSGKRVTADWSYLLGEPAVSMQVVSLPGVPLSILILGKHHVFCLTEYGKLRFEKKLDYSGTYIHAYACVSPPAMNYVVSSNNVLLVYADTILKWTAHVQKTPVQVQVTNFDSLRGAIVCLSEDGHVACCYLGTDPAMMVMPSSQLREINYDEQDAEMRHLQALIKDKSSSSAAVAGGAAALGKSKGSSGSAEEDLQLLVQVASELDAVSKATDVTFHDDDRVPSIAVKVTIRARVNVSAVKTSIRVDLPLVAVTASAGAVVQDDVAAQLGPGQERTTVHSVYMKYDYLPCSTAGEVSVAYTNGSGAPRVQRSLFSLPAKLVMRCAQPQKTAVHKVTIDTNKAPVSLVDIFADLSGLEASGSSATAIAFQFYGGSPSSLVTLLASKTSQRYRLQSDDFGAMWLVTSELADRLQKYYRQQSGTACQCSYSGPLPVQEYLDVIDAHFEGRVHVSKYKELLEQRAAQFRVIQKRLLTRFKDKTPTPLANLDTLLEGTFRQILALADGAEDSKKSLTRASNALGCATRLFNYLIRMSSAMSDDDFGILQAALSPFVNDGDQGWEETTDAALTHLLRTSLSKSSGPKDQAINPAPLAMPEDTSKLKKHVQLLCERLLSKGGRLSSGSGTGDDDRSSIAATGMGSRGIAADTGSTRRAGGGGGFGAADGESGEEVPIVGRYREKKSPRAPAPAARTAATTSSAELTSTGSLAAAAADAPAAATASSRSSLPPLTSLPLAGAAGRLPALSSSSDAKLSQSALVSSAAGLGATPKKKKTAVPDLDALMGSGGSGRMDDEDDPDAIDI